MVSEPVSSALLSALFDRNPWPMFVYDVQSYRFLAVNDAALHAYGYSRDEMLAMTVLDIRPEEDRERLAAWNAQRDPSRGYRSVGGWWRHIRRDGSVCEVRVSTLPWMDYNGRPAAVSVVHDLAESDRPPSSLLAQREALQAAHQVGNFGDVGTIMFDLRQETCEFGGMFERLFGCSEMPVAQARAALAMLWHPHELDRYERLARALDERAPYEGEHRMVVEDDVRAFYLIVKVAAASDQTPSAMIGIAFDITARKREEARLRKLAFTDSQTGLPNYAAVVDGSVARAGVTTALLVRCALVAIPSSYASHEARARSAAAIGAALRKLTPSNAELIRYSEDTFALLVTRGRRQPRVPLALAKRVIAALERPLGSGDAEFVATPTIGVGAGNDGCDVLEVVRRADAALREATRTNVRLALYSDSIDAAHTRRATLEFGLRHAIGERRIEAMYQPLVSLQTGEIAGAEALMRWDCPGIGPVSPAEFIPIAEECGLIGQLGEWILREACAQNRRWQLENRAPIRMAVNVSVQQVQQRGFVRLVHKACEITGLDPSLLELELTERVMLDRDSLAMRNLHAVRRLGVRVAVDDFGTGYSALSYLAALPLDTLKLDRSFIASLGQDEFQRHVAASIVDLAHRRGLAVVGEGVETAAELESVRALGCDEAQGYLLGRPVHANSLGARLRTHENA